MELTDDDVLEILKLFEQSKFDFLQLQQGERKITVSKGGTVVANSAVAAGAAISAPAPVPVSAAPASPLRVAPAPAAKLQAASAAADAGLVPVTAPMVGKFYA